MTPVRLIVAVVFSLLALSCAGGDDDTSSTATIDGGVAEDPVFFDLNEVGEFRCEDVPGDVTTSAVGDTPPPVPMPDLDLLSAYVWIEDGRIGGEFELAAEPRPESRPEYVLFIGLFDDPNAFELRVVPEAGDWVVQLRRAGGTVATVTVAGAEVTIDGAIVRYEAPLDQVPVVQPNQPVGYGAAGIVVDADGRPTGADGLALPPTSSTTVSTIDPPNEPPPNPFINALDECLDFLR